MDEEKQPLLNSTSGSVHYSRSEAETYNEFNHHSGLGNNIANSSLSGKHAGVTYRGTMHHSMVDTCEKVTLSWNNVNVHVKPPQRLCCRGPDPKVPWKHVLRDVHGIVKPGTLLAILGASGSGKTTLLNTLTSRSNSPRLSMNGDIRVNGVNVGRGIRNISAYVQQDDLFIATMTVREHLTFRALLRMDKSLSKSRRLRRVEEVIQELGLTKCAENIIGNPERQKGISGGEMRRLSFASEVLTNPPLLFCDEATSGLDSFMAENIVQTLKTMAGKGKTILCTIHQPSSEVYALFDQVLIMAEGRTAFLGAADEALEFFKSAGYPCPVNYNPADFFIQTLAVVPGKEETCRARVEGVCDTYEKSEVNKELVAFSESMSKNPRLDGVIYEEAFSETSRYESGWGRQFAAVFLRCMRTTFREPMVLKVRLAQTLVIAILLGLIYLRTDVNQTGVMNFNGVLFLLIMNMVMTNVFAVANTFPIELPIFLREYGIGLYRVDVYFFSKMFAELPMFIFIPVLFSAVVYFMVGLYESADAFLICCGVLILVANISVSFGYLISTAANSVNTALAIAPPLLVPLIMFGGFFLNSGSVPDYFIWLEYLSWFKYSNELLAINQWQNIKEIGGCHANNPTSNVTTVNPVSNSTVNQCEKGCLFRDGNAVIDYLQFDKDNTIMDISVLCGLLVGYRLIAFIILFIKARRSKA